MIYNLLIAVAVTSLDAVILIFVFVNVSFDWLGVCIHINIVDVVGYIRYNIHAKN